MKILVSGAFGYIGSQLVPTLLGRGHRVGALVRCVPDHAAALARSVHVHTADIRMPIGVQLDEAYDIFVHLAAANDIDSQDPEQALLATALGTRNCLQFCTTNGIRNFVYFSTFQVYGTSEGVVDEDAPPAPLNDYAVTHLFGEEYARMYSRTQGLNCIILRPTNVYGPLAGTQMDRWSLVPSCFCKEAYEKGTITLMSSGKQLRDFISLHDLAEVTASLCENFDAYRNRTFNVARGESNTIIDTAMLTKSVYESLFGRSCQVIVMSEEPHESRPFQVRSALNDALPYRAESEHDLRHEITSIFHLLKGGDHGSQ